MKKFFFAFAAVLLSTTMVLAQENDATSESTDGPVMQFENETIDYGKIERGSEKLRVFNFTNVGNEPLIIKNAKGSCGCTVPSYPKEPIMPGETGVVEVRYDTNRMGRFSKSITLTTNEATGTRKLYIKGEVLKPEEKESAPEKKDGNMLTPNNG